MHRLRTDRRGGRVRRRPLKKGEHAARCQGGAGRRAARRCAAWGPHMNPVTPPLKFVSTNRRVREDRRFVVGQGHYVADIALEGVLHVALVPSQHPAAKIVSIDATEALKMPGVHYALTGDELAKATEPLMNGLDTPNGRRFP